MVFFPGHQGPFRPCEGRQVMEGGFLTFGWRLCVLVALLVASCSVHQLRPVHVDGGYLFQLRAPGARTVALTGTFNGWSESACPMANDSDGLWTVVVPVTTGRYRYMFIVTGNSGEKTWVVPTWAPAYVPDGFGG